jgi:hypothetical protein
MFELDVKALSALSGTQADPSLKVYQYLETLTLTETFALLGEMQQYFGVRHSLASGPVEAVQECVVSLQAELRRFESNVPALLAVLSALAEYEQPVPPLALRSKVPQLPVITLAALQLSRSFAAGTLVQQIEEVLTARVSEAIEAGEGEALTGVITTLSRSSDTFLRGRFATELIARILTHQLQRSAPRAVSPQTVSLISDLAGAVLRKERSKVSELVAAINDSCGMKQSKDEDANGISSRAGSASREAGWVDWWRDSQETGWIDWWREQP